MSITPEEVKHIALLSRLELKDEEVPIYTAHLAEMLEYVENDQPGGAQRGKYVHGG